MTGDWEKEVLEYLDQLGEIAVTHDRECDVDECVCKPTWNEKVEELICSIEDWMFVSYLKGKQRGEYETE